MITYMVMQVLMNCVVVTVQTSFMPVKTTILFMAAMELMNCTERPETTPCTLVLVQML